AERRRAGGEGTGEPDDRMASAEAQACPRKQRPSTVVGAVEAIGQEAPDAGGRLRLACRPLTDAIGLGQGRWASLLRGSPRPDDAATDPRRQIDLPREAAAMRLISPAIAGQNQSTPGPHHHQTLWPQSPDQPVAGHGRDLIQHRAPLQTEATM